jgi:hypothetical protein
VIRVLSLGSLRLTLLAAAGLGVASCDNGERLNPIGHGGAGGASATTGSATSSTGGAGGASSASSAGGGISDPVCAGATAITATNGTPSGFVACPDGTLHRNQVASCDPTIDAPACDGTENSISCQSDADCIDGPRGRCAAVQVLDDTGLITVCGCFYSCADDAECGAGNVCVCGGVLPLDEPVASWSVCAPAACLTGADCPSGECGLSAYDNGCKLGVQLACRSETDVCRVNADCQADAGPSQKCLLWGDPTWRCTAEICPLGRPLLVEGRARTAPAVARDDWAADVSPDLAGLDASARAALAQRWLDAAAMEHASVASFARFTLELLALGAPAALIAEAQRAGLDEVEHARIAYGLASAYAGRALGPGPLDLGALRVAEDPLEVMRSLIEEACVGETLGVVEALALADLAVDPVLRGVHQRIAADEQRHAELAWRTLAWLLDGADDATQRFAGRCFEDAIAAPERDDVRRQAIREVVEPCAAALLGRLRAHRAEPSALAEA